MALLTTQRDHEELIEAVARELKEFEKSIVLEEVNQELVDSRVIVKTQAQEIKQKKKELSGRQRAG